jgi:FtsP/CotA-like multicopper oxidase with cupredoxin domain
MRRLSILHAFFLSFFVAVIALAATAPAVEAQPAPNPCAVPVPIDPNKLPPFRNPPPIESVNGFLTATLNIGYTNPATTKIGQCGVTLRSYNGGLVGPTLIVKPGDTIRLLVRNNLPRDPTCKSSNGHSPEMSMMGPPAIYNVTNLHTHGLHVSPGDNPNGSHQDNIFVTICPGGETAPYEIHIPSNHPSGTFWYHAHVHGSTAIQVASAMEGAIIVKGGLDNVVRVAADQIFVLQQISYGPDGKVEDENTMYDNWEATGSRTMVNGQLLPVIRMRPGELQRWRVIHAGVDQSLYLKTNGGALYEIATDGNALGRVDAWRSNLELEPGYRSDVLFQAPMTPGRRYYLMASDVPAAQSLLFLTTPGVLAKGQVQGTAAQNIVAIDVTNDPAVNMPLPTQAQLAPLAPYKPITREELTGAPQNVVFAAENAKCDNTGACRKCVPSGDDDPVCTFRFMIGSDNDTWYVFPNGPTRTLKLGTASSWTLAVADSSGGKAHPFHIHVNPFQMVRVGPDGRDETVWKDTLMVRQAADVRYRTVLSRYEDYPGAFVIHCHILPHEDKGMMQKVVIVP